MADAPYDSTEDTLAHIAEVRGLVWGAAGELSRRGLQHDASKLEEPEKAVFDVATPKLRDLTYGSPEYEESLAVMGRGLKHHYEVNDHHPEHFPPGPEHETDVATSIAYHPSGDQYTTAKGTCSACDWEQHGEEGYVRDLAAAHEREHYEPGGIHAMGLVALTEMLCDWIAATRRHADGDIHRSIDQNAERFNYGDELTALLHNSVDELLAAELKKP